jgi:transposase InsO family protein
VNKDKLKVGGPPRAQETRLDDPPKGQGDNLPKGPVDLDPKSFPDQSPGQGGVPCTVDNVRHMLTQNGIEVRYNVIKKRTFISVPWVSGGSENSDAVAMTHIQSLASRYGTVACFQKSSKSHRSPVVVA